MLRRRSLAALRAQVEPVSTAAFGRFLPAWQQVGAGSSSGVDGLHAVIEQIAGVAVPASALEPLILGQRVRDYQPAMLDELLATGEVVWSGMGAISGSDGWIALHIADTVPLSLPTPAEWGHSPRERWAHPLAGDEFTDRHRVILDTLGHGGGFFFRQLADGHGDHELKTALWELVWAGWVTGDTFTPVRARLAGSRRGGRSTPAHRQRRRAPRLSHYSVAHAQTRAADPTVAGRWSALPPAEPDSTMRAHFSAELLLGRYGVLTKGSVAAEGVPGGFGTLYKVLTALEDAGRCQRGYFVESLGGAQFAVASTVDRLRSYQDNLDPGRPAYRAVVLAAADPANPYGSALPWPTRSASDDAVHRPGRKAGALVVLVDGELVWFLERGGRSLLTFSSDADAHRAAASALADLVTDGRVASILVERVDGVAVHEPAQSGDRAVVAAALAEAGFARTPRGLRLRH
jgi:ATP-dependent Lhr-like helicase